MLAAGIAHDCNHLEEIILANKELAQQILASGSRLTNRSQHIQKVAGPAAEIVRQMIAYAGL